jgi:hypothetical protein
LDHLVSLGLQSPSGSRSTLSPAAGASAPLSLAASAAFPSPTAAYAFSSTPPTAAGLASAASSAASVAVTPTSITPSPNSSRDFLPPFPLEAASPLTPLQSEWLNRPPVVRELLQVLRASHFSLSVALALIRRCTDLYEHDPMDANSVWELLLSGGPRLLLMPALLSRVAAPSEHFQKHRRGLQRFPAPSHEAALTLLHACDGWIAQRYLPLVHAEVLQLFPEYRIIEVNKLIIQYLGNK